MIDSILVEIFSSQWRVPVIIGAWLFIAAEIGFRLGIKLHHSRDEARRGQIGGILGATLGLLALLLAFTFSMAVARFDNRSSLVLQEANAIGTAYRQATLLPASGQTNVEAVLRHYADVRIAFYNAGADRTKQAAAEVASVRIQRDLWNHIVAEAKENPSPHVAAFLNDLNDMIELDATRLNALRTHVPGAVWLLVLSVAFFGCAVNGFAAGASGARSALTSIGLPLLITVVISLIADLDRPRGGLIAISQQPMLDLRQAMQTAAPPENGNRN